MTETTIDLSRFGHENISFTYDEMFVLPTDVNTFTKALVELVESGRTLAANETIEYASAMLRLGRNESNSLILQELDMTGTPGKFADQVSHSLAMVRTQIYVLESIGQLDRGEYATVVQSGICCSGLDNRDDLFLSRSEPSGRDSGIFVGCCDDNHDHDNLENLQRESVYTLICRHPILMPFLAIPVGFTVTFKNGNIRQIIGQDGASISVDSETFLGRLIERGRT